MLVALKSLFAKNNPLQEVEDGSNFRRLYSHGKHKIYQVDFIGCEAKPPLAADDRTRPFFRSNYGGQSVRRFSA